MKYNISNFPKEIIVSRNGFKEDCCLILNKESLASLKEGKLKLIITKVGSNSVVTKSIPPYTIAVGNPARVVRSNITWSRYLNKKDELSIHDIKGFMC